MSDSDPILETLSAGRPWQRLRARMRCMSRGRGSERRSATTQATAVRRWSVGAGRANRHVSRIVEPTTPQTILYAAEGAATAPPLASPMASLLTRHLLRDGEMILLVLKPSLWYILLSSLRVIAVTLIVAIAARLWMHANTHTCADVTVFCIAARFLLAAASWIGRLYVLTDQRVLQISGVLNVDICDCPLRKVARTRVLASFREKLLGLGSVEIIPQEEERPCALWQTIAKPVEINDRLNAAIRKAKSG